MHKRIMENSASRLMKDAKRYEQDAKHTSSKSKKQHDRIERKEAVSAAKDLKERARKAHEY